MLKRIFFLYFIFFAIFLSKAFAESSPLERKYSATLFYGQSSDSELLELLTLNANDWQPYRILGLGLNRQFVEMKNHLSLEMAGQLVRHFEQKNFYEADAFLVLRAQNFPWDAYLLNTFAFGEGVSYTNKYPSYEVKDGNVHKKVLNYILIEATFALPKIPDYLLSLRIHHRSGVFGLYNVNGGSDYVCAGITKWF